MRPNVKSPYSGLCSFRSRLNFPFSFLIVMPNIFCIWENFRTSFSDISTLRMAIPLVAYYEEIILKTVVFYREGLNSQLCQFSGKVAAKVHPKHHFYLSLNVVGLPQFNP
jgi:hypothetical protein